MARTSAVTNATTSTTSSSTSVQDSLALTQIFQLLVQNHQAREETPQMPPCTNYSQEQLLEILSNPHSDLPPDELQDLKDQFLSSLINKKRIGEDVINKISHHVDLLFLIELHNLNRLDKYLYKICLLMFQMFKTLKTGSEFIPPFSLLQLLMVNNIYCPLNKINISISNYFKTSLLHYISSLYGKYKEPSEEIEKEIRNFIKDEAPSNYKEQWESELKYTIHPDLDPKAKEPWPETVDNIDPETLQNQIRPSLKLKLREILKQKHTVLETKEALFKLMEDVKSLFEKYDSYKPYSPYGSNASQQFPHYADTTFCSIIDSIVWHMADMASCHEEIEAVFDFVKQLDTENNQDTASPALLSLTSYYLEKKDIENCFKTYKQLSLKPFDETFTEEKLFAAKCTFAPNQLKIFALALEMGKSDYARELCEMIPDEFSQLNQKLLDLLNSCHPKQQAE